MPILVHIWASEAASDRPASNAKMPQAQSAAGHPYPGGAAPARTSRGGQNSKASSNRTAPQRNGAAKGGNSERKNRQSAMTNTISDNDIQFGKPTAAMRRRATRHSAIAKLRIQRGMPRKNAA